MRGAQKKSSDGAWAGFGRLYPCVNCAAAFLITPRVRFVFPVARRALLTPHASRSCAARLAFLPLSLSRASPSFLSLPRLSSSSSVAMDSELTVAMCSEFPDAMSPGSIAPKAMASADLLAELQESVLADSESLVPAPLSESIEVVLDSIVPESEPAPDSLLALLSESLEVVPDSGLHENREAWNRAHSVFWPCSRYGLVHLEYMLLAMFYGFNEFDCKDFIPDLDKVERHGDSVVFDAQVLQMLRDTTEERELAASRKDDDTKATVR